MRPSLVQNPEVNLKWVNYLFPWKKDPPALLFYWRSVMRNHQRFKYLDGHCTNVKDYWTQIPDSTKKKILQSVINTFFSHTNCDLYVDFSSRIKSMSDVLFTILSHPIYFLLIKSLTEAGREQKTARKQCPFIRRAQEWVVRMADRTIRRLVQFVRQKLWEGPLLTA